MRREGLYIADDASFPSPIAVNPRETIMALATRKAERLIEARTVAWVWRSSEHAADA